MISGSWRPTPSSSTAAEDLHRGVRFIVTPPRLPATPFRPERLALSPWQLVLLLLIAGSVWLRVVSLGRLPGINADEAWYGVQMLRLASGEDVSWRTPTGNLMGPVQPSLLFFAHLFAEPSFALLRLPAVLSGSAAVLLAYLVLRRHFDAATAWIGATLTAALPANIAYSRFGWDASHSGVFALLTLHFALAGSLLGSTLSFAVLLWVHPTNVLAAPFFLLAFAGAERERSSEVLRRTALLGALLLCASLAVLEITTSGGGASIDWRDAAKRAGSPAEWWRFAILFQRFLAGDVTHEYVAGIGMGPLPKARDLLIVAASTVLLGLALQRMRPFRISARTGVLAGFFAALLAFAVLVGSRGITPHTERYGYCLLVPAVTAGSIVLRSIGGVRRWPSYAIAALLGLTLLWHFERGYFREIRRTGSTSHPAFWTGAEEPKAAAARWILRDREGRGPVTVLSDGWWTYWPLAYLLHGQEGVSVVMDAGGELELGDGAGYLVGFPGGPLDLRSQASSPERVTAFPIPGYGRRIALMVWRLHPAGAA